MVPLDDGTDHAEKELIIHHERLDNTSYAYMLSRMDLPNFPVPFGILRAVDKPTYSAQLDDQVEQAIANRGAGDLAQLYHSADTWVVED